MKQHAGRIQSVPVMEGICPIFRWTSYLFDRMMTCHFSERVTLYFGIKYFKHIPWSFLRVIRAFAQNLHVIQL